MDDEASTYITADLRKLEKYVRGLPKFRQMTLLDRPDRERLGKLEDTVYEARRLAHDTAQTEDFAIKRASLGHCQEQLELFRSALLAASQTELVDTVDVAQLSAMADQVVDYIHIRLKTLA